MSNTAPTQAITTTSASAMKVTGAFKDAKEVTAKLQHAAQHYHLVSPATACGAIPEGCSIALSTVLVDIENETYDVGGYGEDKKFGLAKPALDKIAAAAGISWDARFSGRLDDGSDPHYVMWRAVGQMRHLDGSLIQLLGTKEMDLREHSAQLEALYDRFKDKHAKWISNGRKGYEPKAPTAQIREMRLHIVGHAESKARLRAIRSLGIRSAYKAKELAKPFVIAKLMWTGQSDDPELRRAFALKQADAMLGGHRALYGDAPPPAQLPSLARMPALEARRPPPLTESQPGDRDAIEVPPTPPSEPKAKPEPKTNGKKSEAKSDAKPDAKPEPTPESDGPVCRFGKQKGTALLNLSDEELDWYTNAVNASVDEPEKAKFKSANEAHLKECRIEFERRNGSPPPEQASDEIDRGDDPDQY